MAYALKPVQTDADWQVMHDIRRATLFAPVRHADNFAYDDNHPEDRREGHAPFLLVLDGTAIGVVRLDRRGGDEGVVRLVAIVSDQQRHGHGRAMSALVDAEARRRGMSKLNVNAHRTAVGFYRATGWAEEAWDASELMGLANDCVQMTKTIPPP